RNLEAVEPDLDTGHDIDLVKPLIDAQTSGGLLVALPEAHAPGYLAAVPGAARIGKVTVGKRIRVT
ncbi:MAG TPA: hypothetical protein VK969_01025, partial [Acidimicrobiia bacterium]|nr:hypothetical protein [Acidimicrobiia bacterium]